MPLPMSYTGIANDLEDRIRRGEYPPGSKLPTLQELGTLYGVGYTTIHKAIALLKDRGIVVSSQGRGVYVTEKG